MRCIIWDFDGTLAERSGMWTGALAEAAEIEGVSAEREALRPHLHQGFPWHSPDVVRGPDIDAAHWWRSLEPLFTQACTAALGVEETKASAIARRVRQVYTRPDRWRVFEDVLPCLDVLSSNGWRHAILSNHVPELAELLKALGLSPRFDAVFSSGVTGVEKPNPLAFKLVQEHFKDAVEFVMVGDSWAADISGAARAGITAVLVRRTHPDAERCCRSLDDLPAALDYP
ncbi:MAG: HAD family hydrolase [Planctomycetota bacterium]